MNLYYPVKTVLDDEFQGVVAGEYAQGIKINKAKKSKSI